MVPDALLSTAPAPQASRSSSLAGRGLATPTGTQDGTAFGKLVEEGSAEDGGQPGKRQASLPADQPTAVCGAFDESEIDAIPAEPATVGEPDWLEALLSEVTAGIIPTAGVPAPVVTGDDAASATAVAMPAAPAAPSMGGPAITATSVPPGHQQMLHPVAGSASALIEGDAAVTAEVAVGPAMPGGAKPFSPGGTDRPVAQGQKSDGGTGIVFAVPRTPDATSATPPTDVARQATLSAKPMAAVAASEAGTPDPLPPRPAPLPSLEPALGTPSVATPATPETSREAVGLPVPLSRLRAEVAREVRVLLERGRAEMETRRGGDGSLTTEMELSPAELGRLRIVLHSGERGLHVSVMVDRPDALETVRRHLEGFHRALMADGVRLEDVDIGTGGSGGGYRQDEPRGAARTIFSPISEDASPIAPPPPAVRQPAATGRLDIRL